MATATEGGHFYLPDGTPFYTVVGKNGKERPTTLRDARAVMAVPSVTTVSSIIAKPGLQNWMMEQAIDAALTLPKQDSESLQDYKARVILDAQETARKARDRGTQLHTAIEMYLRSGAYELAWEPHITEMKRQLTFHDIDLHDGSPEKSFAHAMGFGGKLDWSCDGVVIDYKSKQAIGDPRKLVWPEHAQQLAAYREGLGMPQARCFNVFIGVEDCAVVVVEHDQDALALGWRQFEAALTLWKLLKGYDPGRTV